MNFNKDALNNNKYIELLKKHWIPVAAVLVVLLVVFSLGGIYKDEVLEEGNEIKLEKGEGLHLAAGKIDTLNPIISGSEDTYYLSKLVYGGLFEYTEQFGVKPDLISSYSVDTEKGKINIKLNTGIKWHDGKYLSAKDVKFTINAIKTFGAKGVYYEKVSKIKSVSTKGKDEVTIVFTDVNNCSLDNLVFPIVSSNYHSSVNAFLKDSKNYKPVGTGQYQFVSYNYLKELDLKPNKSYNGSVAGQDIHVTILPDKSLAPNLLETYAVTCYVTEDIYRKNIVADKDYKMYDLISNDVDFIVFNTNKTPFNTKKVRQAVAYAIDTRKVIKDGYMEDGVISNNLYYPGFLGVVEEPSLYNLDMDKAEELLKEAGYEDRDLNGIIENKDKENVSITILINSNNANRVAAAKIISSNLKNIGFNVNIDSQPWSEYLKKVEKNEFDILISGYKMNSSYDLREFFNGENLWKYSNAKLLEKATELEKLHKADKYTEIYTELKKEMLDELPYYTICYRKMGLVGVKYFEADDVFNFDNIYKNCSTWSWQKIKTSEE